MIIRIPCSMTLEENFLNFSENNESNPSVKMQILHEGVNPKGTSFSKEAIEEAKASIYDKPILAYVKYDENGEPLDFGEHEMILVPKVVNGKRSYEIKYIEQPIGTFSQNFDLSYEKGENGKEYLTATGTIWNRYCKDAYNLLKEGDKSVSMEINILESEKDKYSGVLNISKFEFLGVTILGDDYAPGIDGANATLEFTRIKTEKDLINFLNNIEQNVKGDKSMDNTNKYSLSNRSMALQIREQLSNRLIEKQYSWGETYQTREFYYVDTIPDDSVVVVQGNDGYKYYGVPYSVKEDTLTLDFDNKKEYISEWREKKVDESANFALDEEDAKEMAELTFNAEVEKVGQEAKTVVDTFKNDLEGVNKELEETKEALKNANETVFSLGEEVKELKAKEAQVEKEKFEEEVEEVLAKFSFDEEETKEMKEQCLNGEFDVEELNNKLFTLYGKKAFENMKNKQPKEPEQEPSLQMPTKGDTHIPYGGIFENL